MVRPRGRSLLVMLLLAAGLGLLVRCLIVTDREAVERLLERGLEAARAHDVSRLQPLLSPDFTWDGLPADRALAELARLLERHRPTRIEATWGPIVVAGDRADVDVTVKAYAYGGVYPGQAHLVFAREREGWRLLEVRAR